MEKGLSNEEPLDSELTALAMVARHLVDTSIKTSLAILLRTP